MNLYDEPCSIGDVAEKFERFRLARHEYIKYQLRLAGSSLAQVAREMGVGSSTMTTISTGIGQSSRIQLRIAEIIDIEPEKLWPERTQRLSTKGGASKIAGL